MTTTEQLYEQAKRILRSAHDESGNFILACHFCGMSYPEKAEMGMVEAHFKISHSNVDKVFLDLVWIGEGPPPKPNRSQRRRAK